MSTENRKRSWLAHDQRRKHTDRRKMTESARNKARRLPKSGRCELCGGSGPTVWHHKDYDLPRDVIEVCHKCHRSSHPRAMPQGGVS